MTTPNKEPWWAEWAAEQEAKDKLVERLKLFPETIYPDLPEGFLDIFPDTPLYILDEKYHGME